MRQRRQLQTLVSNLSASRFVKPCGVNSDTTHLSIKYLVAVLDGFSRNVLAWRLSVTLETEPCLEALSEALARHGRPEIMNADQGS